ncbi:hypothetical protein D3C80_1883910 [compost metagenome]
MLKGFFYFTGEVVFTVKRRNAVRIFRRLLRGARLRTAGIIAAATGWRGIIAVILVIKRRVIRFEPVRFFHFQPGMISLQTELQHPLRLVALCGNRTHHIFVDA